MAEQQGSAARELAVVEDDSTAPLEHMLQAYHSPHILDFSAHQRLGERFILQTGQPLPEYDTGLSKAYRLTGDASDDRAGDYYGMLLSNQYPMRAKAIQAWTRQQHANMLGLYASEPIVIPSLQQRREALVIEKPQGQPLGALLTQGVRYHEHQVIDHLLTPYAELLGLMHQKGFSHGRINLDNIFVDKRLVLGECFSEPCGYSQQPLFEPLYRMVANPIGKGESDGKADVYALAVVAYAMLYGLDPILRIEPAALQFRLLDKGNYALFNQYQEFSDQFRDFFRGAFNDVHHERWGVEQLQLWLKGKRFNLVNPATSSRDTLRPFAFGEKEYNSPRTLAYALSKDWKLAIRDLRHCKLDRWLETSLYRSDLADAALRIIKTTGGETSTNEKSNNELVSRMTILLDPQGPMRTKDAAVHLSGLGPMFASAHAQHTGEITQQMIDLINADITTFWLDTTSETLKTQETSTISWKLQRIRLFLLNKTFGFGAERALYDLCESLPCQSNWLLPYHAVTAKDALLALDGMARTTAKKQSFVDRHLAAFIASRVDRSKEVKLEAVATIPELRDNHELIVIRLLGLAQEKAGKLELPGLSAWCAIRLSEALNCIHNRHLRNSMRQQLQRAAKTGNITRVLEVLLNKDATENDHAIFQAACHRYMQNKQKISALQHPKTLEELSRDLGGRISSFVAYLVLGVTAFILFSKHM